MRWAWYEWTYNGPIRKLMRRLTVNELSCPPSHAAAGSTASWSPQSDRDFVALSFLSHSLESLHLCLELEGSGQSTLRRDRLRDCLAQLRALKKIKVRQGELEGLPRLSV